MKIWITEHSGINNGTCHRTQVLEVTAEGVTSAPLNSKWARLFADGPCVIGFGSAPPNTPLAPDQPEWFQIEGGQTVTAVVLGEIKNMENLSLLRVLADPKATQTRAEELGTLTAAANKAATEAKAATAEAMQAQAVLAAKQHEFDTRAAALATARQDLDAQAAKLATDQKALDTRTAQAKIEDERMDQVEKGLAARQAELLGRERVVATREKQVAAREDALKVAEQSYSQRMARLKELAS